MSDSAPVVDWEAAREIVGQDRGLLLELVNTFLGEGPQTMNAVRRAIAAQDGKALQLSAHSLKGALKTLGAKPASEAAWALEQKGKQGDTTGTDPLVADLQQELDAVLQTFAAYVAAETHP
jgi:two-component system, sensor histidine kinase and response regulator